MVDGLQANGSLMAMEDLATYTVAEREPIRTEYYGYEVVTVPPPSNGGDWLLEMLNIMEEKDISQYDPALWSTSTSSTRPAASAWWIPTPTSATPPSMTCLWRR